MAVQKTALESVRADDFVEYYLFPQVETVNDKEQELILSKVLRETSKVLENYTKDYLWHKDEFRLTPRTSLSNSLVNDSNKTVYLPPHLYGVSHYGDNIEDEWFMVYLLIELTRQVEGLIGRIHDADGEFLLIEAANYLPEWANPETCQNRVFIYEGKIHLIPLEDDDYDMAVNEAVAKIRDNPDDSLASEDIQNAIKNKLSGYPDKIQENLHRTTAYLPVGVAALLKEKPNLIAPAIQVFCNRDPIDTKVCKAMKYFPPENRVYASVKFTKCLYAMLVHSKYVPDRRIGWNLPPISSKQYKAHDLGVKIASGFEILISQAKPSSNIEQDKGWHNYLNSLKERDYFGDLLEHSHDYNNLLNKAKEYYINHRDSMYYAPSIGQELLELNKSLDCNIDELKNDEKHLPPDEDDSWLNITPEELDKMLQDKYGQKFTTYNNSSNAANFSEKITQFLEHVSDIDGAEYPDLNEPTKPPRGIKKHSKVTFSEDCKNDNQSSNNRVSFDPNAFSCAVQNILNFVIPEDDSWTNESDSEMSDYAEDNCGVPETNYEEDLKMKEYMKEMDKQLSNTTIGESFEKKTDFDDIETFEPVNIDVNALKNLLESYKAQLGEAGPSSNMLGPMGIHLDGKFNEND